MTQQLEAAIRLQIRVELVAREMQQRDLAERMGRGREVINRYLQGHVSMNMRTFIAVAEALEMEPSVLLERAEARLLSVR